VAKDKASARQATLPKSPIFGNQLTKGDKLLTPNDDMDSLMTNFS
jgi:hypothetical protein